MKTPIQNTKPEDDLAKKIGEAVRNAVKGAIEEALSDEEGGEQQQTVNRAKPALREAFKLPKAE